MGDLGVRATESIIEDLQRKVKEQHIKEPAECKELLIESIKEQMKVEETAYRFENEKSVVLVIGVNGVGKTTTVGKLAGKLKEQGKKVVIAGADTFRAAAGDQLKEWANRAGVDMIGGARVLTRELLYMMQLQLQRPETQMCFSWIQPEDSTTKRI